MFQWTSSSTARRRCVARLVLELQPGSGSGWPRLMPATSVMSSGMRRRARSFCSSSPEDPVDGRRETLLDRGDEDQHHRRACVHVPERHGPLDLLPLLELVVPLVALVVVALARHDEDLGGGGLEPRLDALERLVVPERRDLREELRVVDDEQPLPLREPGARRTPHGRDDAFERVARDRVAGVVAHHAALLEQVVEAHAGTSAVAPGTTASRRSSHGCAPRPSKVSRASASSGCASSGRPRAVSHSPCSSWTTAR